MNAVKLYFLLLKATLTTFSGLASLSVLRADLILTRHVLTDQQLNTAIIVTRTTPGPAGLYLVSVGYFVSGIPGAIAGWLAMCTPALLIIPLMKFAGGHVEHPRLKSMIQAVVFASAGLLWASSVPLGKEAIFDPLTLTIFILSLAVLLTRKVEMVWVIFGAAILELSASALKIGTTLATH
jgi:chromate transporter